MRDEIIARAGFLLGDLHLPPPDAQLRLKDYFPDLELEERVRYVREARELAQRASAAELS
ncbi:hypothetical protein GCM10009760_52130 [Kitasatospora kazusensis]|uniref:Uncharacterized protein n=1 Tax=Kitasatospora kazusensis TaxID=407974 RepID=A0ABP5LZJ9_9ACTN